MLLGSLLRVWLRSCGGSGFEVSASLVHGLGVRVSPNSALWLGSPVFVGVVVFRHHDACSGAFSPRFRFESIQT